MPSTLSNESIDLSPQLGPSQDAPRDIAEDAQLGTESSMLNQNCPGGTEVSASSTGVLSCPIGYDSEVFYSLPVEMQMEIVDQHSETSQQMRELAEASGFDYETLAALPENIRQEVIDQARRERNNSTTGAAGSSNVTSTQAAQDAGSNDIDNATFLASLPLELRADVLLTADAEFLNSLPSEFIAEAQVLRERAASNWQRRELIAGSANVAGTNPPAEEAALGIKSRINFIFSPKMNILLD